MSHDHLPKSKDSQVEGMPSIHETVKPEGPFQFDQSLGMSAQQAETARKKKRNKVVASVAGGVILLTGGAFVAGNALGGGETESRSNQNTTASLDPTPSTETQTAAPEVTLESMDAMTSDEFITLPVDDQVNWAVVEANKAWNVEGVYDNDTLAALLGRDSVNGITIDGYNPIYTPLGVDAAAIDIIGQQNYFEQLASFAGADLGRKINSGLTFPGSTAHDYYYGTYGDTPNNPLGLKDPQDRVVINEQAMSPYVAEDGTEYPQRTIVEQSRGTTYTETYIFFESDKLEELSQTPNTGLGLLADQESVKG